MQRVVVVTPAAPVIELEDAKKHLRIDHDDDDDLLKIYIAAATGHLDGPDGWLGRAIGVQELEAKLDGFVYDVIRLPYPPAIDVVSILYDDVLGNEQTLDATFYELRDDEIGTAWGKSWPRTRAYRGANRSVRIRYRAGYEDVPPAICVAILMMVSDMYRFRGTAVATGSTIEVAAPVQMLLQPFRVYT